MGTRMCSLLIQGHTGTSSGGVALLEESQAVQAMVALAETSSVVSLRATCFYALGLLACTQAGSAALKKHGWRPIHTDLSLGLPMDVLEFVHVRGRLTQIPSLACNPETQVPRFIPPTDANEAHICSLITGLGNAVVSNTAWRALAKLHAEQPQHFRSVSLFCRAIHLMDHFALRMAARRHIWSLLEQQPLSLAFAAEMEGIRARLLLPASTKSTAPKQAAQTARRGSLLYRAPLLPSNRNATPQVQHTPQAETPSIFTPGPGSIARSAWPLRITGFAPPRV